jgi:hypothetical protein
MAQRRFRVILGAVSVMSSVLVPSAWALPTHDYGIGWGKGGLYDKHDSEKYDDEYGGKFSSHQSGWGDLEWGKPKKEKGYGGHDFVKWGKGYGTYDPDCDPPVSTPEPGTLLLLGSTLAGLGVYARRRWPLAGG